MKEIPISQTPVIKMLSSYLEKEAVSFHMPGHTVGKSFPRWLHENALRIDTTELDITDDLNHPQQAVDDATMLAARAFGAGKTFFVTCGSTISIYAALLSSAKAGDQVILFRDVHKSVLNACLMYRLDPVFASEETLGTVLSAHPSAVLVFITRPDYYGNCSDIEGIAEMVHQYGKILIVDEAHGTHFAFCPSLMPLPAISHGADLVIQSAHKTVPALTQGSYLHLSAEALSNGRISVSKVQQALSMVTTSSPSFLIAATLDYARAYLETSGDEESKRLYARIRDFHAMLKPQWQDCFLSPAQNPDSSGHFADPFRLVMNLSGMPVTSREVAVELAASGIYVEFYDLLRVVFICKFDNTKEDFILLADVLNHLLDQKISEFKEDPVKMQQHNQLMNALYRDDLELQHLKLQIPQKRYPPVFGMSGTSGTKSIPLSQAAGKALSSALIPYPPGIPLIWPGEILYESSLPLLERLLKYGITIYGIDLIYDEKAGTSLPYVSCFL